MSRFGSVAVSEIRASQCQEFIDGSGVAANSKIHYAKDLSTIFEWASKPGRQWVHENPWTHITLPKREAIEIGILTPAEAERLLRAAAQEPGTPMLANIALGLFAGLRTSERERIDWDAIRLTTRPFVEIKASWAKTCSRRTVRLAENAVAWLNLVSCQTGRVTPRNSEARFACLCKQASVVYPRNGLRHSFASYRYALVRDASAVAADLGHENLRTLKRHYVDVVSEIEAERYFAIAPTALEIPATIAVA